MPPRFVADEDLRLRFGQEAQIGARIASEHVVSGVARGVYGDRPTEPRAVAGFSIDHTEARLGAYRADIEGGPGWPPSYDEGHERHQCIWDKSEETLPINCVSDSAFRRRRHPLPERTPSPPSPPLAGCGIVTGHGGHVCTPTVSVGLDRRAVGKAAPTLARTATWAARSDS
jgi:hypothetical protein